MAELVTGKMIRQALTESEWHRHQVQGFCYKIEPDLLRTIANEGKEQ